MRTGLSKCLRMVAVIVLTVPATASCVCTQAGCDSGLRVILRGQVPETFRLRAWAGHLPLIVECGTDLNCQESIFIPHFTPDHVEIAIESATDTTTASFRPVYRSFRPNGRGCPPDCRVADVEIEL
jgi:hypothetical protein